MSRLLDDIMTDPLVEAYLRHLQEARAAEPVTPATPQT
jgi:hypothetical protein